MKAESLPEFLIVGFLKLWGVSIMAVALVITCVVFVPYLLPKAIIDYFRDAQHRRHALEASTLFILLVAAYYFLTLISQA